MAAQRYPADEFDAVPPGTAVGVHRRTPRGWTRAAAFLAIMGISAGLAVGAAKVWYLLDDIPFLAWIRGGIVGDHAPTMFVTMSVTPTVIVEPSPSPSPTPSSTVIPVYNLGATVRVFDAGAQSFSGDAAAVLTADGDLTAVTTGTWTGASPPANVVRFSDPALQDTANLIGQLLGIDSVLSGPTNGPDIAVVLVTRPPGGSSSP